MRALASRKYFIISAAFHLGILLLFVLGFEHTSTLYVIENTNQNDVISAVVLGDSAKSKILPKPPAPVEKPTPTPVAKKEMPLPVAVEKDVIALQKPLDKKKLAAEKALEEIKKQKIFGKDLLADIKKTVKQKEVLQKNEKQKFKKMLKQQAELSMRQQLLNEDIKLQGTQSHLSQGVINKYKALIQQAISEHWVIPTQAKKHMYCELMIRTAPGGAVLDVQISKTSGDPSLDSSARAAVLKASPLPVPSDPKEFAEFRQFVLQVRPENILEG